MNGIKLLINYLFDEYFQSISPVEVEEPTAYISGWGTLTEGGNSAEILQKAKVPFAPRQECARVYRSSSPITEYKLCAGYSGGGVDSCQGDSGGPLTCPKFGYFLLQGVVSYGKGCARSGIYGVYSRVCSVIPWISQVVGSNGRSLYLASTSTSASNKTGAKEPPITFLGGNQRAFLDPERDLRRIDAYKVQANQNRREQLQVRMAEVPAPSTTPASATLHSFQLAWQVDDRD